jgi:hypothetical protein
MQITAEVLKQKRAEYISALQGKQDDVIALQGAIQAVDELILITESMTETELLEAIERGESANEQEAQEAAERGTPHES